MHRRIWLLVIVITSTYPAPTPQPTIRMCLFFYVKIIEKNSVIHKHGLATGFNFETKWITRISKIFHLLCSLGTKSLLVFCFHFWNKCATFVTWNSTNNLLHNSFRRPMSTEVKRYRHELTLYLETLPDT